jgi:muramoyltetrapeptide carboxypeptidase
MNSMKFPPFLKKGDTIGIVATARKVSPKEITAALTAIESQGYKTVLAQNIYTEDHQFSGTDSMRANGVNEMLNNPTVKALWCARGGYGSVRLIDKIDWHAFDKTPKWLCGFSDVTALHAHLQSMGIASIHCEMMLGFEKNTVAAHKSMLNALEGHENRYDFGAQVLNRKGHVEGELVGGNLSVLYSLLGSESQIDTKNKILFIEDLDEYLYHVDRMMMAIKRAGLLKNIKALIVGGMSDMNDNAVPFGKTAEQIILESIYEYDFPVCFNFPAGHLLDNRALIFGAKAEVEIADRVRFIQKAQ